MAPWRWIKSELSPHLRTSHWHAADWAHGRVSNSFDFGQTQPDLRSFLGFAHPLRSVLPLCAYPSHFLLSCCGLGVRSGRFRFDSGRKQSGYARLGLHPSLRSKLPCTPILRTSCCHATAATRRAASLQLRLHTKPLARLCARPRFGPSALLRTPSHFLDRMKLHP